MRGLLFDLTRLVGFDVESTGINPHEDRIVQAATVTLIGDDPDTAIWLVDPGVEIPTEASDVHGYTAERLAAEKTHTPGQMLFEVTGRLALAMGRVVPVVVANAPYDFTMLEAENARHGIDSLASRVAPKPIGPVIDPMVLDKQVDPYRKGICPCGCGAQNKTLSGLCLHYGVQLEGAHDAGADALAACLLVRAIVARYPTKFAGLTLGGLHMAQVMWRREQANSLRKYFDKNGIEHDGVPTGWPILTRQVRTAEVQEALL